MHAFQNLKLKFICMSNELLVPLNMLEFHTSKLYLFKNQSSIFLSVLDMNQKNNCFKNSKRI